jgi:hypothetical protein
MSKLHLLLCLMSKWHGLSMAELIAIAVGGRPKRRGFVYLREATWRDGCRSVIQS